MNLQDQVCTIEQAKKLRELGVLQESYFWYVGSSVEKFKHDPLKLRYSPDRQRLQTTWELWGLTNGYVWETYSAFSVAELGIMIPHTFRSEKRIDDRWENYSDHNYILDEDYPTEAQARAALLIHLIENNLVTVDEVNKRLS